MPIKLNVPSSRSRKSKNSYNSDDNKGIKSSFNISFSGQFKNFVLFCSIIIVFFIVIFSLGFGVMKLYKFAVTTAYFNTERIEIAGNVRLDKQELISLAGIKIGENSLAVNIGRVERAILLNPWVEKVSIKRTLPRGFLIKIKERIPSFWMHNNGELSYADSRGKIIAPVEGINFISLPTLRVQEGSENILNNLDAFINDIKMGTLPIEFASISSINVNRTKGVELYIEDLELHLSIAVNDWNGNLKRLAITLNDVTRLNELDKIKEIYAADGNVWVIRKDKYPIK